jgi:hypothetical protein
MDRALESNAHAGTRQLLGSCTGTPLTFGALC